MRNNKGISLVEIIIIIAILAVLAGGTISGINYIRYANTKNCANVINAAIGRVRIEAMSKTNKPSLYIYQHNNNYFMRVIDNTISDPTTLFNENGTRLSNSQVQLCYRTSGMDPSDPDVVINDTTPEFLRIGFVKNTGGIEPIAGTNSVNQILIRNQNGTLEYTITLVQATGKHIISKN